jgi:PAS domain-containing protein
VSSSVYLIDRDARFIFVNEEAHRALEYRSDDDEFMRMMVMDIDPARGLERWRVVWEDVRAKGVLAFKTTARSPCVSRWVGRRGRRRDQNPRVRGGRGFSRLERFSATPISCIDTRSGDGPQWVAGTGPTGPVAALPFGAIERAVGSGDQTACVAVLVRPFGSHAEADGDNAGA